LAADGIRQGDADAWRVALRVSPDLSLGALARHILQAVDVLAGLDGGVTLLRVAGALSEIDDWWAAP
jgi:hypothetical protein